MPAYELYIWFEWLILLLTWWTSVILILRNHFTLRKKPEGHKERRSNVVEKGNYYVSVIPCMTLQYNLSSTTSRIGFSTSFFSNRIRMAKLTRPCLLSCQCLRVISDVYEMHWFSASICDSRQFRQKFMRVSTSIVVDMSIKCCASNLYANFTENRKWNAVQTIFIQ